MADQVLLGRLAGEKLENAPKDKTELRLVQSLMWRVAHNGTIVLLRVDAGIVECGMIGDGSAELAD